LKKKRRKPNLKQSKQPVSISYVCSNCGLKEDIPVDVLEYFDEVNPEQLLYGSHQFTCEKCKTEIMNPEREPEIMIKGFGLFEGIEKR
jgi:hypothetical protein